MPASPFDSAIYRDLLHDGETARLLSDTAEVRALLLVEGALAKAQAKQGLIPETAAAAIHRDALSVPIDPAGLSEQTGRDGVVVPALVAALRKVMQAPDHSQFLHHGATSQDIIDTALVLRLRQMLVIWEDRLAATLNALATLAEAHSETPMAGRTWGQIASPTTFGAVVAAWGTPLLRQLERLAELRPRLLVVSLSGAVGTGSALGPDPGALRAELARALNLNDPGASWHSARDTLGEFGQWIALTLGSLSKMANDIALMTASERGEITLATTGASSTMPQKQNPVQPALIMALAGHASALAQTLTTAQTHAQQRDGAPWFTEWLAVPPLCMAMGRATVLAQSLAETITPDPGAMLHHIDPGSGLIHSEALSFALARRIPRPEAQAIVKRLCLEATPEIPLHSLLSREYPDTDWATLCTPAAGWGTAPADARRFAATVRMR